MTAPAIAGGVAGLALAGLVAAALMLVAVRRRLVVVEVRGSSMAPTLHDGERLMVRRVRGTAVRPGQVTVVEHPDRSDGTYRESVHGRSRQPLWMIKRCVAVAGDAVPAGLPDACRTADGRVPDGVIVVFGDNPTHPNDSRRFGFLPCERVLGVVAGARGRSLTSPGAADGKGW